MQKATKASGNAYYTARIRAAEYDDRLHSRESASQIVCIDRTRLANIELGNISPHPEEVNLMACSYNAPDLMNYYCSSQCPLGCGKVDRLAPRNLESAAMKIGRLTRNIDEIAETISDIAEDGQITEKERPVFEKNIGRLLDLKKSIEELILAAQESQAGRKSKEDS